MKPPPLTVRAFFLRRKYCCFICTKIALDLVRVLHLMFDPALFELWELTRVSKDRRSLDGRNVDRDPYDILAEHFNDYGTHGYQNACGHFLQNGTWQAHNGYALYSSIVKTLNPCNQNRSLVKRDGEWLTKTCTSVRGRLDRCEMKYSRSGQQEAGPEKWYNCAREHDAPTAYAYAASDGLKMFRLVAKTLPPDMRADDESDGDSQQVSQLGKRAAPVTVRSQLTQPPTKVSVIPASMLPQSASSFQGSPARVPSQNKEAIRKANYRARIRASPGKSDVDRDEVVLLDSDSDDEEDYVGGWETDRQIGFLEQCMLHPTNKSIQAYGFEKLRKMAKGKRLPRTPNSPSSRGYASSSASSSGTMSSNNASVFLDAIYSDL
jgi:hypothetical protein